MKAAFFIIITTIIIICFLNRAGAERDTGMTPPLPKAGQNLHLRWPTPAFWLNWALCLPVACPGGGVRGPSRLAPNRAWPVLLLEHCMERAVQAGFGAAELGFPYACRTSELWMVAEQAGLELVLLNTPPSTPPPNQMAFHCQAFLLLHSPRIPSQLLT